MAKTPRIKVNNPSKHSRAARRAAEPPSKTLTDQIEEADSVRHIKQTQRHAGVSKRKSKAKPLTRAQRIRREKGMERAEAVLDQLEIKRATSSGRGRRTKERSGAWEDVNGKIVKEGKVQVGGFAALGGGEGEGEGDEEEWVDEDDGGDAMQEKEAIDAVTALHVSGEAQNGGGPGKGAPVAGDEDEDEVL